MLIGLEGSMLAALVLVANGAVAADLTPEMIQKAIADTKTTGCYSVGGSFMLSQAPWGCFTTPYSRIVQAAGVARVAYQKFEASDVTVELVAPGEIHVYAFAQPVKGQVHVHDVEAIVIAPKGSKREGVILPIRSFDTANEFKNLLGASTEGRSMTAVFPVSAVSDRNEIRVVYRSAGGTYEMKAQFKLDKIR